MVRLFQNGVFVPPVSYAMVDMPGIVSTGLLDWLDFRPQYRLDQHSVFLSSDRPVVELTCSISVLDRDGSEKVFPLSGSYETISQYREGVEKSRVLEAVKRAVGCLLAHEIDESIQIGGRRPWDPHTSDDWEGRYSGDLPWRESSIGDPATRVVDEYTVSGTFTHIRSSESKRLGSWVAPPPPTLDRAPPDIPAKGPKALKRPDLHRVGYPHQREYVDRRRGLPPRKPIPDNIVSFAGTLALLEPRFFVRDFTEIRRYRACTYNTSVFDPFDSMALEYHADFALECDVLLPHPRPIDWRYPGVPRWNKVMLRVPMFDPPDFAASRSQNELRRCLHTLVGHVLDTCVSLAAEDSPAPVTT